MFICAASVEVSGRSVADIAECLIFAKQLNIFYYECDDNYAAGSRRRKQFLIMMVLIFGVMYFLMIRPQQKKQKELVKFRNALEKGQKIVTAGGIYGTVKEVKEGYVLVEVDSNVAIRVDKNMVMRDPSDIATPAK